MSAGFFPSKMITTENIVKKKPKVKIASKRIEANPEAGSCVFLKTEIMNNKRGRDVLESKNKKFETNKFQKSAIPSPGERKSYAADNLKVKSSAMGTKKCGLEAVEECRKEKRRKMAKELAQNGLLPKTLMSAKEEQKFWNWGRTNVGQSRTSAEEMQKLSEQILEVSRERFLSSCKTTNGLQQSERKMNHERGADGGHRSISGSAANVNAPLNLVTSKCGSCGGIRCQCNLQRDHANSSASGLCSERSLGCHLDTSRKDYDGKIRSSSQISKSDLDSDGSARALAQERICSLNKSASREDCTPLVDVQLSPKMALHAAKLRSRYAEIILKANTFLAHGDKADLVLLQKKKESPKRQQHEEKFETEAAQTRASEAASRTELKRQREQERKASSSTELKKQQEQERKAARLALELIERTVEIDDNLVSLKDLSDMLRGSWSDIDPAVLQGPIEGIHVGNCNGWAYF